MTHPARAKYVFVLVNRHKLEGFGLIQFPPNVALADCFGVANDLIQSIEVTHNPLSQGDEPANDWTMADDDDIAVLGASFVEHLHGRNCVILPGCEVFAFTAREVVNGITFLVRHLTKLLDRVDLKVVVVGDDGSRIQCPRHA